MEYNYNDANVVPAPNAQKGKSIAAIILGAASIVFCCNVLCGIVAVIMGIIGLNKGKDSANKYAAGDYTGAAIVAEDAGKKAKIGLIIGIIGVILMVILIVALFALGVLSSLLQS